MTNGETSSVSFKEILIEQLGPLNQKIEELNNKIEENHQNLSTKINENHQNLTQLLQNVEKKAEEASKLANDNKEDIKRLESTVTQLNDKLEEKQKKQEELEDLIIDQIDRNLRNTIIVRGLPKANNERTWDDTAETFVNYLSRNLHWDKTTKDNLYNDIERIHRGKDNNHQESPPAVFIKFYSWKTAQNIIKTIITAHKNKDVKITAHQMYSKRTQSNMDAAENQKKELLRNPDYKNCQAYVKYPGIIMIKKDGDRHFMKYN